jgi:hypothetical protein
VRSNHLQHHQHSVGLTHLVQMHDQQVAARVSTGSQKFARLTQEVFTTKSCENSRAAWRYLPQPLHMAHTLSDAAQQLRDAAQPKGRVSIINGHTVLHSQSQSSSQRFSTVRSCPLLQQLDTMPNHKSNQDFTNIRRQEFFRRSVGRIDHINGEAICCCFKEVHP